MFRALLISVFSPPGHENRRNSSPLLLFIAHPVAVALGMSIYTGISHWLPRMANQVPPIEAPFLRFPGQPAPHTELHLPGSCRIEQRGGQITVLAHSHTHMNNQHGFRNKNVYLRSVGRLYIYLTDNVHKPDCETVCMPISMLVSVRLLI